LAALAVFTSHLFMAKNAFRLVKPADAISALFALEKRI